jgi:hypothetical protein
MATLKLPMNQSLYDRALNETKLDEDNCTSIQHWNDYEDIAMGLYEKFGDNWGGRNKIYRVRFE